MPDLLSELCMTKHPKSSGCQSFNLISNKAPQTAARRQAAVCIFLKNECMASAAWTRINISDTFVQLEEDRNIPWHSAAHESSHTLRS
jgi:hypothetical protein